MFNLDYEDYPLDFPLALEYRVNIDSPDPFFIKHNIHYLIEKWDALDEPDFMNLPYVPLYDDQDEIIGNVFPMIDYDGTMPDTHKSKNQIVYDRSPLYPCLVLEIDYKALGMSKEDQYVYSHRFEGSNFSGGGTCPNESVFTVELKRNESLTQVPYYDEELELNDILYHILPTDKEDMYAFGVRIRNYSEFLLALERHKASKRPN